MSNFPKGGNLKATRDWLDEEGFTNVLVGWKADAILGLEKVDVCNLVPGENGMKLWGFLNTARLTPGKFIGCFFHCLILFLCPNGI